MQHQNGIAGIEPVELQQWLQHKEQLYIIDTLSAEWFEKRHIPGATNACVFEVTFPEQIGRIVSNRDWKIVLYGSSNISLDAVTAAEKLVRLGYRKIYVLTGGIAAWREAGFPLTGSNVEATSLPSENLLFDDGRYRIDTRESLIEWTGRNPNTRHYGTVRLSEGILTAHENQFSGKCEIDMESIENVNLAGDELQPVLISHLKSDDFFFTKHFPRAVFTVEEAKPFDASLLSSPNYEVIGALTLRGVNKEMCFLATFNKNQQGDLVAEAHFDIDRTQWNVKYGSSRFFEHLGMHLVFDPVTIQLRLLAQREKI